MTLSVTHSFLSTVPDGPDNTLVKPSDWNHRHNLTAAASVLLGNPTSVASNVTEVTLGSGLSFSGNTLNASGAVANPTNNIGLTTINGVATTAMRSDAAPALDQSISPTWTGAHTFTTSVAGTTLGLTAGSIADGAHPFTVSATLPATLATSQEVVRVDITPGGSSAFDIRAFRVVLEAGYTGPNANYGISSSSLSSGTGNTLIPAAETLSFIGNIGVAGGAPGTGGLNIGTVGHADNATTNVGLLGLAQVSKNSGTNIGVVGSAYNAGTGTAPQIGGWFCLNQTSVPTVSAALIADNGSQSSPVFLGRVNGSTKVTVDSTGNMGLGQAPDCMLALNNNTGTTTVAPLAGTLLHMVGSDGTGPVFTFDAFGSAASEIFLMRNAANTRASPNATAAGTLVSTFGAQGYDGVSAYGTLAGFDFFSLNQTSTTDHSSYMRFRTVASGSAAAPDQVGRFMRGFIVGNGTTDPGIGNLTASGWVQTNSGGILVSALPAAAAGNQGARAFVTDASVATFNTAVSVGGGANKVPVFSDGATWRIG